jgi:hypothetical protein
MTSPSVAYITGSPTQLVTSAASIDPLGPIATIDADDWSLAVTVDAHGTILAQILVAVERHLWTPGGKSL